MIIGYTFFDPLIVLCGTLLTIYFLTSAPIRLMAWLPAALTIYFFLPFVTLLTLWQTVPLVLAGRAFLNGRLCIARWAQPIVLMLLVIFLASLGYALVFGLDLTRALIRAVYYIGTFALLCYCYEMARRPECYEIFLKGLAFTGAILAAYGAYQIVAGSLGLPVRGIVRGTNAAQLSYEYGIIRINSFASEPKRLGYVLFVCGLASLFLARALPLQMHKFKFMGYGTLFMSLFTFSGSYFLSVVIFALSAVMMYPTRAAVKFFAIAAVVLPLTLLFPELGVFEAIQYGFERRAQEFEVGLDGTVVYRQEFYAWDFLERFPLSGLFGVGLGQYFISLFREYGEGVGISSNGGLLPLNSTFLELMLDFGAVAAFAFYSGIGWLILKLRKAGETYLCLALLFLTIQSFTILTLQFIIMFAGVSIAVLNRRSAARTSSIEPSYDETRYLQQCRV